jgi:hypothetical protein
MSSRSLSLFVAGLAAAIFCLPVFAEPPGNYWGAGYTRISFTAANGEDMSTHGGTLRIGREFFDFFAIEVHAGLGRESQSNAFGDKFEYQQMAAFARLNLPYERFNFYLLGGSATVEIDTGPVTADETFAAGGAGMDFFGSERTALTLEFLRHEENDAATDLITIGVKHHFDFTPFR